MKKLLQLSFVLLLLLWNISPAQTIDDFNYTGNLTDNGWSVHSGTTTNPIATTAGLTYTGYVGSGIGNAALIQNLGGQDVNQTAGVGPYSTDGDVIYFSFMVNVTESGTKTGDYFIHIGNRVSTSSFTYFCARVFAKVSGGVVNFGISNSSTATYGTTNFATNTTYLLVVKYIISTAGNDEADLWVFSSGVPSSETLAGTPEVSNTSTLGQDIVNAIALRQGSSSNSVQTVVDGIRLDTSWSGLLPQSGLAAPVATAASNITANGFTANWNHSAGATNYWLDVSTASDFSTLVTGFDNKDVGNVATFDVSSLSTGFTYYYRVRASNANGTSTNSNIITVDTGVLDAPLARSATNITTTSFTARWNSSATATTYLLDVSAASDFSTFITDYNGKDVGNVTSCNVTSLSSSTIYYYRVRASNSGGTSANSNTITVTTLLAAPVAIAATNITTSGFTANWNASTGATNYWVDVSTTDDFSNVLASYNNKSVGNVTTHIIISLTPNTTYYFRVCASNSSSTSPYSNTITVTTNVTGVDDLLNLPTRFDLSQNYPNPFNPITTIKYQIPEETFVGIKVYNLLGSEVTTLVNEMRTVGTYEVKFNASQLTSGIYIYKIQAGQFSQMKKMVLVK
ncbi:MAG: fibronectin type III domain-containing protein [Bacteroidetes bacterium]|nr:fibronectin type III domain-containing protein [Bacteroidota bacterium]